MNETNAMLLSYIRADVRLMTGYVPGEQPRGEVFIKLNTNENPYPPSPRVQDAITEFVKTDWLRKYPDPVGVAFCKTAGKILDADPEGILLGNGSDEILTILTRTFVSPGGLVVYPYPTYPLYPILAEIHGARFQAVPFTESWSLPHPWPMPQADLTFVANPNSPSGTVVSLT